VKSSIVVLALRLPRRSALYEAWASLRLRKQQSSALLAHRDLNEIVGVRLAASLSSASRPCSAIQRATICCSESQRFGPVLTVVECAYAESLLNDLQLSCIPLPSEPVRYTPDPAAAGRSACAPVRR